MQRLYINIAKGEAEIYVHQTAWPRQPQNPNWRIEVTDIDGRYGEDTQTQIFHACLETAREYLQRWLDIEAPLLTIATITWPELARLASQRSYKVMSTYQKRRRRKAYSPPLPYAQYRPAPARSRPVKRSVPELHN